MKIRNIVKLVTVWLILGLGLSMVRPVRAQFTNDGTFFQYGVFYNGLLEFSDCSTLAITGPVHCNSNIYVGTTGGNMLIFNQEVSASGIITNPANFGYAQSAWTGTNIFNGMPAPGYQTGFPAINWPLDPSSYREMINPPTNGENPTNILSEGRYYSVAEIVIMVTDSNIVLTLKNPINDNAPISLTNGPAGSAAATNWTNNTKSGFFLTTNATFYDAREGRTNHVSQIDVGLLGTWVTTNTNCINKWGRGNSFPYNGVVYVQDVRDTNAMWMDCVRITNGASITNGFNQGAGLTIATQNPLYVWGNFNCPNTNYLQSTNTAASQYCSFVCDAFTVLSAAWKDANSAAGISSRTATNTTINAAILTGNVPSTGSTITTYSGGAQNLPRLLENWTGQTLWMNTSLVCLYSSAQATAQFQQPGAYYEVPTRKFFFDQRFNTEAYRLPGAHAYEKAAASVTLTNLEQNYDGTPKNITVVTIPAGLSVNLTYASNTFAPSAVGSYAVTAVVNDIAYGGFAINILVINEEAATVTLSNLLQVYDGTAKSVSVTTIPPGLTVDLTYNGSTSAPTNAGSYVIIGTIDDTNYQGSATNNLVIAPPAPVPVTLSGSTILTDGTFQLNFTNTPGASFSVLGSADPTAPLTNWTVLGSVIEVSPGQFQFTDTQATNTPLQFYLIRSP